MFDVVSELKNNDSTWKGLNSNTEKDIELKIKELQESKQTLININEELIQGRTEAEYNEKLKSAFLTNMSHEIRTPINAILEFSNLLKENNLEKEKNQQFINLIQDSGKRLFSIISDNLDISKINTKQLTLNINTHNLNEILDSLYHQFSMHPKAKKINIKVIKALNNKEAFIKTDKNRLSQVLSHLIENALKFTNEGTITFGYEIESKNLQFFVQDSGLEIAAKYRDIVFDECSPLEHTDSLGYRNGPGLLIAKDLVELLKGNIWIDPNTKKGVKFLFTIPYLPVIHKAISSSISKKVVPVENMDRHTILIVEDDNSNFIYLREVIKRFNLNIMRAHNGIEALELFKKNSEIDLIFMDIKMPEMNGYQATIEIRKIDTNIPIIALTAFTFSEDETRALAAGCNEYMSKPVSRQKIEDLLLKYFNTLSKSNVL